MLDKLFDTDSFLALKRGMDVASLRQQVIADNLANANVPGYKRKEVHFEEAFRAALERKAVPDSDPNPRHLPIGPRSPSEVTPTVSQDSGLSIRLDGSSVDVDVEMTYLAENEIRFQSLAQMVSGRYNSLRTVIREGR
ncbi:MAG: flagellar basal body rod protein FlgB [Armatimonadetes bacterium]|nr:flagellar basal body rod protein FlgB [Armatimonadota bacterium]